MTGPSDRRRIMDVKRELEGKADPERARAMQRFFRTGPGEYGEGDVFIGVTVPEQRAIAKKYKGMSFGRIRELLDSRVHEHRLTGLLILAERYRSGSKEETARFYMDNLKAVNNWDLVDLSAPGILGEWLVDRDRSVLYGLAAGGLWERRIAVVSTLAFIRRGDFRDTLKLAEVLMEDREDLIRKAVGWMLREVGKRDRAVLEGFLDRFSSRMPRTMLRYAVERLPEDRRRHYMGN